MEYCLIFETKSKEYIESDEGISFEFEQETSLHQNPIRSIIANPNPNILPINIVNVNDSLNVTYKFGSRVKLSQILKKSIGRADFLKILLQILKIVKQADNYYANENSFIIDKRFIYVDQEDMTPALMYMPLDLDVEINQVFRDFLMSTLKEVKTLTSEDITIITQTFKKPSFRVVDIYNTIYSLLNVGKNFNKKSKSDELIDDLDKKKEVANTSLKSEEFFNNKPDSELYVLGSRFPSAMPKAMGKKEIRKKSKKDSSQKNNKKETSDKKEVDWGNVITNFVKKKMVKSITKKETKKSENKAKFNVEAFIEPEEKELNIQEKDSAYYNKEAENKNLLNETRSNIDYENTMLMSEESDIKGYLIKLDEKADNKDVKGERFDINNDLYKIGRDKKYNDLVLDDIKISKKHAKLIVKEGEVFIVDSGNEGEGSTNGVYINDEKIAINTPVLLKNEDKIRLAKTEFLFYLSSLFF